MLSFRCNTFQELSNDTLYEILKLRQQVFIVEQNCPYLDTDDKDQESLHIIGTDAQGVIHAYTRLVPPGLSYEGYSSIGRVITSEAMRGKKQGVPLMQFSINTLLHKWPDLDIKISAQVYITKFYNSVGFEEVGEEYLEDNIPHIAMIRKTNV